MIFTPFAFMAETAAGPSVPTSGLIGWYDASDYTSGATWVDRSSNGLDLTLSGTYSKDASTAGGPSVLMNTAYAVSATTALISGTTGTEYTWIEIVRPTSISANQGTFVLSANAGGDDPGSVSGYRLNTGMVISLLNAQGGKGAYDASYSYATSKTSFISRRFAYGVAASAILFDVGDSAGTSLVQHTGTANAGMTAFNYNLGSAGRMVIGGATSGGNYRTPGYYCATLVYDRQLSDSEVSDIYNYYKSTYSLA